MATAKWSEDNGNNTMMTTNRYESHYISLDFIMCIAMIKCIMATIHSYCVAKDYIVKYRKIVSLIYFFYSTFSVFILVTVFLLPFSSCYKFCCAKIKGISSFASPAYACKDKSLLVTFKYYGFVFGIRVCHRRRRRSCRHTLHTIQHISWIKRLVVLTI